MTDNEGRRTGRVGRVALLLAALGLAVIAALTSGLTALTLTVAAAACVVLSFVGPLVRQLGRLLKPTARTTIDNRSSR